MSQEDAQVLSSGEGRATPPLKKRLHAIWDKFERIDRDGSTYYRCTKCPQEYKKTATTPTATNLKYHWDRSKEKHDNAESVSMGIEKPPKRSLLNKGEKFEKAFSDVLSIPSLSINTFLHPAMQNFISLISKDFKLPKSFATLKNRLLQRLAVTKSQVKEIFRELIAKPSITADIWTDASLKTAYLGVTVHYVRNGALKSSFLGLKQLSGSHVAVYVKAQLQSVLEEYEIGLGDVFKIVTDNGSNMLAALTEVLNLTKNYFNEEYEDSDDDDFGDLSIPNQEIWIDDAPQRVSCYAHSLQLVILKTFKEKVVDSSAFKKMSAIIRRIKHSHLLLDELSFGNEKSLKSPSATRWGSIIMVIKCFLELQEVVLNMPKRKNWLIPDQNELEFLSLIAKLCSPFIEVLKKIQGEKSVTISHCLEYTEALLISLDGYQGAECMEVWSLVDTLRASLKERFANILNRDRVNFDPIFFVSCALDPNTSCCMSDDELSWSAEYIRQMLPAERRLETLAPAMNADTTLDTFISRIKNDVQSNKRTSQSRGIRSKSWILNALHAVQDAGNGGNKIDAIRYWTSFINSDWNTLAILALEVLSVPATSAPIERIFSQAGIATKGYINMVLTRHHAKVELDESSENRELRMQEPLLQKLGSRLSWRQRCALKTDLVKLGKDIFASNKKVRDLVKQFRLPNSANSLLLVGLSDDL